MPQITDKKQSQQELKIKEVKCRKVNVSLTETEYNMLAREAEELPVGTLAWQIIRKHLGLKATLLEALEAYKGKKGRR